MSLIPQNLSYFAGDSKTATIALNNDSDGSAFTPGADYHLIFTAKGSMDDEDTLALFQYSTGVGITHAGSGADVVIHPADTRPYGSLKLYWDIQAENLLVAGDIRTVAIGTLSLKRDATRQTTTSVPIHTVTPGVPYTGPAAAWGNISGNLPDQADLAAAMALKAPLDSPTFTGPGTFVGGITAASVTADSMTSRGDLAAWGDAGINGYLNVDGNITTTAGQFIGAGTGLTGTAASLTAGAANGLKSATTTVSVSAATAPTAGQVLKATSSIAATWQTLIVASLTPPTDTSVFWFDPSDSSVATYNGTAWVTDGAISVAELIQSLTETAGQNVDLNNSYQWLGNFIADSYFTYSLGKVSTLFGAMDGPAVFDGGLNRSQTSAFPHACFTGHAFGGGWADAGGLRFTAVTKRHMVGCAHYGYTVGSVIKFKAADNSIITRTITEVWRPQLTADYDSFVSDFQVFLLNSDLPTTIRPVPVVGDWYRRYTAFGSGQFRIVNQSANLILWNNQGHATPGMLFSSNAYEIINSPIHVIDGLSVQPLKTRGFPEPSALVQTGYESLNYGLNGGEFYHNRYYGDSGSPAFAPVSDAAGSWALCGIVSGQMWTPSAINEAIARLDSKAGISTGYTVTVAPNPTI